MKHSTLLTLLLAVGMCGCAKEDPPKPKFAFRLKPGKEYCISGMNGEVVQVFPVVNGKCDMDHPEDIFRIAPNEAQ